jgi:hypothetical protein
VFFEAGLELSDHFRGSHHDPEVGGGEIFIGVLVRDKCDSLGTRVFGEFWFGELSRELVKFVL